MNWIPVWSQAITAPMARGLADGKKKTCVFPIPVWASGNTLRFRFSNINGKKNATVGAVTLWIEKKAIPVTVNGKRLFQIPAGKKVYSDEISVDIQAESSIEIRIYYPEKLTDVNASIEEALTYPGNVCDATVFPPLRPDKARDMGWRFCTIPYLDRVELYTEKEIKNVVAFGDSITAMNRWCAPLQERLYKEYDGQYMLQNAGISGNCLLYVPSGLLGSGYGAKGVDRFERDVLAMENLHAVIIGFGVNDASYYKGKNKKIINLDAFASAITSITEALHRKNVRVAIQTLSPRKGYPLSKFTDEMEKFRQEVNTWIRESTIFDYVLDADMLMRSENDPTVFADTYHQGDYLHPNKAGAKILADAYDLKMLLGH